MPGRVCSSCLVAAAAVFLLTAGCGRSDPTGTPEVVATEEPRTEPAPKAPRSPQSADDPAAAFGRISTDLAEGRADSVIAALPERYRSDLDRRLAETVLPLDPAARRDAADAVAAFAEVLAEKKEFLLGSDRVALEGPAAEFVRDHFDAVARVAAAVARWPVWGGEEIDSASLIETVVRSVAAEPGLAEALRGLRFETVSRTGDRAVVRVRSNDAEGAELSVVRIDGRWVPAKVADHWETLFPADADSRSTDPAGGEDRLRRFAERLREVTATLKGVSTQVEFDALADRAATALMAAAAQADPGPRPVREDEFVTVLVLGDLDESQKDRLLWEFAARTDAPSSGIADAIDRPEGDGMRVTVGPVGDIGAFAKRLPGVTVEQVDPKTRTITARVAGP